LDGYAVGAFSFIHFPFRENISGIRCVCAPLRTPLLSFVYNLLSQDGVPLWVGLSALALPDRPQMANHGQELKQMPLSLTRGDVCSLNLSGFKNLTG